MRCKLNSKQPPNCQHNHKLQPSPQDNRSADPPTHRITHDRHSHKTHVRMCRGSGARTVLLAQPATPFVSSLPFARSHFDVRAQDERISRHVMFKVMTIMLFLHMLAVWIDTNKCTFRH